MGWHSPRSWWFLGQYGSFGVNRCCSGFKKANPRRQQTHLCKGKCSSHYQSHHLSQLCFQNPIWCRGVRTWAAAGLQVLLTRDFCFSGFIWRRRVLLKQVLHHPIYCAIAELSQHKICTHFRWTEHAVSSWVWTGASPKYNPWNIRNVAIQSSAPSFHCTDPLLLDHIGC